MKPTRESMTRCIDKWASGLGSVLEWYDFALYGFFSPLIAQLYFPSASSSIGLLKTFSVFGKNILLIISMLMVILFVKQHYIRKEILFPLTKLISLIILARKSWKNDRGWVLKMGLYWWNAFRNVTICLPLERALAILTHLILLKNTMIKSIS